MRAGQLRHRIKIESRVDSQDASGQPIPTWSIYLRSVPSSFEPSRGREYFVAQGLVAAEAALFRIRYRDDIDTRMRVQFRQKVWDIASIEDYQGRQRESWLYCATGLTMG